MSWWRRFIEWLRRLFQTSPVKRDYGRLMTEDWKPVTDAKGNGIRLE